MLLIGLQVGLKKPLCIDSKIVNKIDRQGESIYSCDLNKKTVYSSFFHENIQSIEIELKEVESAILRLGLFSIKPIDISGQEMAPSLKEKVLKQILISQYHVVDDLFLDAAIYFLLNEQKTEELVIKIFLNSFEQMNVFDKQKLRSQISMDFLKLGMDVRLTALEKLSTLVLVNPVLAANFRKQMIEMGFHNSQELEKLTLDLVVEADIGARASEKVFEIMKTNSVRKIGLKNKDGFYIFPAGIKVPVEFENKIYARQRLVLQVGEKLSLKKLAVYEQNTEKLFLANFKTAKEKLDLNVLLRNGINQFLYAHNFLDFVQIHIPSYRLKKPELRKVDNFFSYVNFYDKSKSRYQLLGWQKNEWSDELRAFKSVAVYDVIQLFRTSYAQKIIN